MKKIVILGSTGSVGTNALDVIGRRKDEFKIVGLSANSNVKLLAKQTKRFKPRLIALGDISRYNELKRELKRPQKVLKEIEGISEIACMPEADIVLVAITGTSAILPVISAIKAKKKIALANKESIVSAGNIIMNMARTRRARIIPVDSEHSSIFQCMEGRDKNDITKIFLMGTGGPLKDLSENIFDRLKPSRILRHPVWKMGKKISVDSATMMNKGLEVIEACHLFGVEPKIIEVLLHPEAIIHSMIEFADGNVISNMFHPDMRFPISYALDHPRRLASKLPKLNFSKIKNISFQKPNSKKFPALKLCYEAVRRQGTYPACLNSANEEAVDLYLKRKITFTGIMDTVKKVLSRHKNIRTPSLDEILYVDKWAKEEVKGLC